MRELDRAIIRLAVGNAKEHMRKGSTPEEAAVIATRGVWGEYRQQVLFELVGHCTAAKVQIRKPITAKKTT